MVDVKKLVTGFLILASVTASSVFIFSSISRRSDVARHPAGQALERNPSQFPLKGNAFLPPNIADKAKRLSGNLTKMAAKNLGKFIVGLNPNGPLLLDGEQKLVLLKSGILAPLLAAQLNFGLDDLWTKKDDVKLRLVSSPNGEANGRYADALKVLMQNAFGNPQFSRSASPGLNRELVNSAILAFDQAVTGLTNMDVPETFASFHKNLIVYLADQENILLAASDRSDPLKILVILKGKDKISKRLSQDYLAAAEERRKIDLLKLFSESRYSRLLATVSSIKNLFTIPSAFAQEISDSCDPTSAIGGSLDSLLGLTNLLSGFLFVPVRDAAVINNTAKIVKTDTLILTMLILDCNRKVATEVAKHAMIQEMESEDKEYVQNEGEYGGLGDRRPRFISNYENYFSDAAGQGALRAYARILPNLCPSIAPLVAAAVNPGASDDTDLEVNTAQTAGALAPDGSACSLENKIPDLSACADDFFFCGANAGWDGYLAIFEKSNNNLFGSIMENSDVIGEEAVDAAAAANAEAQANQGYRSDMVCVDSFTDPDTGETTCVKEEIVTPGSTAQEKTNVAVDARYEDVANAQDYANFENGVADDLGTQLIVQDKKGLANLALQASACLPTISGGFNAGACLQQIESLLLNYASSLLGVSLNSFSLQGLEKILQQLLSQFLSGALGGLF